MINEFKIITILKFENYQKLNKLIFLNHKVNYLKSKYLYQMVINQMLCPLP